MGAREATNENAGKWALEAGENASTGTFGEAAAFGRAHRVLASYQDHFGMTYAINAIHANETARKRTRSGHRTLEYCDSGLRFSIPLRYQSSTAAFTPARVNSPDHSTRAAPPPSRSLHP